MQKKAPVSMLDFIRDNQFELELYLTYLLKNDVIHTHEQIRM